MDLINEASSHSNLSTKSEEICINLNKKSFVIVFLLKVDENTYLSCNTTREKTSHRIVFEPIQKNHPLTCRNHSNLAEEFNTIEEKKNEENDEKIGEINRIYEEKIKVLEARFFKNKENSGFYSKIIL